MLAVAIVAGLAVAILGMTGGQPLMGFRYSVFVNNLASECSSTVVAVDGPRLTLDDGRILVVDGPHAMFLAAELRECENRVRFDPADRSLHTMRRVRFYGFDRPGSRQLITIPLTLGRFRQFSSRQFAGAREARAPGGPDGPRMAAKRDDVGG